METRRAFWRIFRKLGKKRKPTEPSWLDGLHYLSHDFYKMEHFFRSFSGVFIWNWLRRCKVFAPKFIYVKAAFIYIEMDVSFVKIWSAGFPDFCIRIESFDGDPGPIADSFVVCVGQNKKCIQFIVLRLRITERTRHLF